VVNLVDRPLAGLRPWYIALPPLLLVGFLTGLFFLATAGQIRLQNANDVLHVSQLRQQALSDYLALIRDADTAQRDYLLTGDTTYLAPHREAVAKLDPTLDNMRRGYVGNAPALANIETLRTLTVRKLGEIEATLALYTTQGAGRAIQLVRTDLGKRVMADIRRTVREMQAAETRSIAAATSGWSADVRLTRWLTSTGAVLNIILVLIASRLTYIYMQRRMREATRLRGQKHDLEQQVDDNTKDFATLSAHLLTVAEREKASLARELHDELGGLLVASHMDLSWVERHLAPLDSAVQLRMKRIHQNLSAGVDLKRRIVEELRPTLLDNMGLFSALRWQLKETCAASGLKCSENYPAEEPRFAPDAAIAVFRILQEAVTNILKHAGARAVDVDVAIDSETFTLRITDDGKGILPERLKAVGSHGLASMRHRIAALGGTFNLKCPEAGGTMLTAQLPLNRALAA
jgi:signal transduction histidine kinase